MTEKQIRKEYKVIMHHFKRLEKALYRASWKRASPDGATIREACNRMNPVKEAIDAFWVPEIGRIVARTIRSEI